MGLLQRIRDWRQGYSPSWFDHDHDDPECPPLCVCGHFFLIHGKHGCEGMAYDQWARWGRLHWVLECRCKLKKLEFDDGQDVGA